MTLNITVLGSGSRGNAFLVHNEKAGILIDAGFSRKEIFRRLAICGFEPEFVKAMLITHEHVDHTQGVRVTGQTLGIPTYASIETAKYLQAKNRINEKVVLFDSGSSFEIGDFTIQPFSVPHDALEPVGFVVSLGMKKIGLATDLGHVTRLVAQRLKGCDALVFESNHDINMLRKSTRPLNLIRRILGRHGHLNNVEATEAFCDVLSEKTRTVILSHLSGECNCPDLVAKIAQQKLAEMERTDILLRVAEQSNPLKTITID